MRGRSIAGRTDSLDTRISTGRSAMTRFFFDTYRDGEEPEVDELGVELPGLPEVRSMIVSILPALTAPALICGDVHDIVCIVRGEDGAIRYKTLISVRGEVVSGGQA